MLYATTRSKAETYTARRVLDQENASDGGQFVPFKIPVFSHEQLQELLNSSCGQIVATILNLFFSSEISGWDVDCRIGKSPVSLKQIGRRDWAVQTFENPKNHYGYIEQNLYDLTSGSIGKEPTGWAKIAIRIAVLFASAKELYTSEPFDVAVNTGDFTDVMAAWYAREMGLYIGRIICVCNENSSAWEFLTHGELDFSVPAVSTSTPKLDMAVPACLEQLVYHCMGTDASNRFAESYARQEVFCIRPDQAEELSKGLFITVVSNDRIESIRSSILSTKAYALDAYAAITLGGLQDYRAKTGERKTTILFVDQPGN